MHVNIQTAQPQIKVGPVAPAVAGQLGRLVAAQGTPFALMPSEQWRYPAGSLSSLNIAGLGPVWMPKRADPILSPLSDSIDDLQRDCLAAKLCGIATPVTAAALMVIGNGKNIQKMFDPKATPVQKIAGVTGIASTSVGWAHEIAPAAEWLTPYATTFKVVDLAANGVSLAADLRSPNRNLGKCFYTGIKLTLGIASIALTQFPQLASIKSGVDTVSIVLKIGDRHIVAALENTPTMPA